mgnify:CR=1 FL=1
MSYFFKTEDIKTSRRAQLLNITQDIKNFVSENKIQNGTITVYCPHTTAAITVNEGADPDVSLDIENSLDKLIPWNWDYAHSEGNSAAHLKSSLVGCAQQLLVHDGNLVLGTWQAVYFCEFDGPRSRKYHIQGSNIS